MAVMGTESLVIDSATLNSHGDTSVGSRDVVPPEWVPWSLISGGAVTILYSITIPQKLKG
jgi:hypothetical protein